MVRSALIRRGLTVNIWSEQAPMTRVDVWDGVPCGEFGRICLHGSVERIGNWKKEQACS